MISAIKLEEVLLDQQVQFRKNEMGVARRVNLQNLLNTRQIVVITGIRRCGKSVLLRQLAQHFEPFYYTNFEDERLFGFQLDDFQNLMLLAQKQVSPKAFFFDEIQNIPNWEHFIRRIHEEGHKIFITGSNAKLLSSDLGTHLTGRYIKKELFSFYMV